MGVLNDYLIIIIIIIIIIIAWGASNIHPTISPDFLRVCSRAAMRSSS